MMKNKLFFADAHNLAAFICMTTRFRLHDGVNSFSELYVALNSRLFFHITIFHFIPVENRKIKQIDLFEVGWKALDATGRFSHISNKKTTTPIRSLNMCRFPLQISTELQRHFQMEKFSVAIIRQRLSERYWNKRSYF